MNHAKTMCKALLEKCMHRYETNEQYIVSDMVSYECTAMEELFRPLWGIAPLLKEKDFVLNYNNQVKMSINVQSKNPLNLKYTQY